MNNNSIFLSVVIPAYNEAKRIGPTLEKVTQYLQSQPYASEVIVVDDGSSDETSEVVLKYAKKENSIALLNGEPNHGKGYAVRRGMNAAHGEYRLFMDADGSTDIRELDRFWKYTKRGYGIVIGSIGKRARNFLVKERAGAHRRLLGNVAKFMVRKLAALPDISDTQRGFKLFTKKAALAIFPRQKIERFGFDIEVLVIAKLQGFKIKELPVAWDNPDGSTVKASDYFRTFRELFEIMSNRLKNAYV